MFSKGTVGKLILLFLLIKLSYLSVSVVWSRMGLVEAEYRFSVAGYTELAMRKDAFWYKKIATQGCPALEEADESYFEEQSVWAFFPAYPLFNRWLSRLFALPYERAALLASLLFSIGGLLGFYFFCRRYWRDQDKAVFGTLLLLVFPFHFSQSMFLTEAPFFLFLIWAAHAVQTRNNALLALLLLPLVLLRPNGLVLLLPLYLYFLEQRSIPLLRFYRYRDSYLGVLLCLPACLAFLAYGYYQYLQTGFFFAFSLAQQAWGKSFMFPLLALFRQGNFNYQATSWYVILICLLLFFGRKKLPLSFHVMVLISLFLPLTAGSTFGMIRYISVIFPVSLLYVEMLYPVAKSGLLLLLLYGLHLGSFYLWFADYPIGF